MIYRDIQCLVIIEKYNFIYETFFTTIKYYCPLKIYDLIYLIRNQSQNK